MKHTTAVPTNFKLTERQVAERIGKQYLEYDAELTDEIREAADAIVAINDVLWSKLNVELQGNITITPIDPYESYEEMCQDIEENNHLAVFSGGTHPTYYGSNMAICREENIRGRAIHDYFGHYLNGVDFSFRGEFMKWHFQKRYYPEHSHRLLFSEVVGQTGAAYYLEGGFDDPAFEQKPIMAPQEWIDLCYDHLDVEVSR